MIAYRCLLPAEEEMTGEGAHFQFEMLQRSPFRLVYSFSGGESRLAEISALSSKRKRIRYL